MIEYIFIITVLTLLLSFSASPTINSLRKVTKELFLFSLLSYLMSLFVLLRQEKRGITPNILFKTLLNLKIITNNGNQKIMTKSTQNVTLKEKLKKINREKIVFFYQIGTIYCHF